MVDSTYMKAAAHVPDVYTDLNSLQKLRNNENKDEALRQVAEQFESMFLSLLLKNMRGANAVFEEGSPFKSHESGLVRDMYDQQLSLSMAQGKGTGLAEVLYRQLQNQYGDTRASASGSESEATDPSEWRRISGVTASEANTGAENHISEGAATRAPLASSPAQFVEKLMPYARTAARTLAIDPLLLIAQAALETGWGQKTLADSNGEQTHNLFNIKSNETWQGESVSLQALEYQGELVVRENSSFKKYGSIAESFADFVALIQGSPRYAAASNSSGEPRDFVEALHNGGYATDPQYTDKVLAVYKTLKSDFASDPAAPATEQLERS